MVIKDPFGKPQPPLAERALSWILKKPVAAPLRMLAARLRPDLGPILRELNVLRLNAKNQGYRIVREQTAGLGSADISLEPRNHGLASKPTTQRDVESPWFAYWCKELRITPAFHRKLWEYAFVLQALFDHGKLKSGQRALGFGCGEEPIASYLASKGIQVTVTDLDPSLSKGRGWIETRQHASSLDKAYKPEIVSRQRFDELVQLQYVDMNAIPAHLDGQYDFCWSICALEHLGSIEHGLRFVERAMRTLRPGGTAVHTTEFNYLSEDKTVDHMPVVLLLKKHVLDLRQRLEHAGYRVFDVDFDIGDGPLDGFIDVPPYAWDGPPFHPWGTEIAHLKLSVDGFPCTCFGIITQARV
jgi:2-polyprenyl-3-methyl-5-hydroxy-6-metoxy-1,4-benzoquinol methylase